MRDRKSFDSPVKDANGQLIIHDKMLLETTSGEGLLLVDKVNSHRTMHILTAHPSTREIISAITKIN